MKKTIVVLSLLCISLVYFSCASKKGAYITTPEPIIKTDTVFIVKRDTVIRLDTIIKIKTDTVVKKEIEQVIPKEPTVKEEKISFVEGEKIDPTDKEYHIIVGSFKNKNNAQQLQKSYKPDFEPTIAINENGMFRVILLSFENYVSAKNMIQKISNSIPEDTWILKQKK